jgi:hypothetical protein
MNGKCRNDCKQSLKGFNLNNPGFQPGDRKAGKTSVREEARIEKPPLLRTELKTIFFRQVSDTEG